LRPEQQAWFASAEHLAYGTVVLPPTMATRGGTMGGGRIVGGLSYRPVPPLTPPGWLSAQERRRGAAASARASRLGGSRGSRRPPIPPAKWRGVFADPPAPDTGGAGGVTSSTRLPTPRRRPHTPTSSRPGPTTTRRLPSRSATRPPHPTAGLGGTTTAWPLSSRGLSRDKAFRLRASREDGIRTARDLSIWQRTSSARRAVSQAASQRAPPPAPPPKRSVWFRQMRRKQELAVRNFQRAQKGRPQRVAQIIRAIEERDPAMGGRSPGPRAAVPHRWVLHHTINAHVRDGVCCCLCGEPILPCFEGAFQTTTLGPGCPPNGSWHVCWECGVERRAQLDAEWAGAAEAAHAAKMMADDERSDVHQAERHLAALEVSGACILCGPF
jgi:hypothetical protein